MIGTKLDSAESIGHAIEYCESHNIDLTPALEIIESVDDDCAVLFAGSIVEGLANIGSDIDFLVLGDSSLGNGSVVGLSTYEMTSLVGFHGRDVNFSHYDNKSIERFARRCAIVHGCIKEPKAGSRLEIFGRDELQFLNRVRSGVTLKNGELVEYWRNEMLVSDLHKIVIVNSIIDHLMLKVDAVSESVDGDQETSACMMQISMDALCLAVLGAVGETVPNPKWRIKLLKLHKEKIGVERAEQLVQSLLPRSSPKVYLEAMTDLSKDTLMWILTTHPNLLVTLQAYAKTRDPDNNGMIDTDTGDVRMVAML